MMVNRDEKVCGNCTFWTDYSDRVHAVIPGVTNNHGANHIELRRCRYVAPPTVETWHYPLYTPENHTCGEFSRPGDREVSK